MILLLLLTICYGGTCDHIWVTGGVNLFLYISGIDIGNLNVEFLKGELANPAERLLQKFGLVAYDYPEV